MQLRRKHMLAAKNSDTFTTNNHNTNNQNMPGRGIDPLDPVEPVEDPIIAPEPEYLTDLELEQITDNIPVDPEEQMYHEKARWVLEQRKIGREEEEIAAELDDLQLDDLEE